MNSRWLLCVLRLKTGPVTILYFQMTIIYTESKSSHRQGSKVKKHLFLFNSRFNEQTSEVSAVFDTQKQSLERVKECMNPAPEGWKNSLYWQALDWPGEKLHLERDLKHFLLITLVKICYQNTQLSGWSTQPCIIEVLIPSASLNTKEKGSIKGALHA